MQQYPGLICLARLEELLAPTLPRHEDRVGTLAAFLCAKLGTVGTFAAHMKTAARFHDIGKVTVPDAVWRKEGGLSEADWEAVRRHPTAGYSILAGTSDPALRLAATVALTHQERFDGTGYPAGLWRDEIPLPGRITALCDVYDALREDRPYRPGMDHPTALRVIVAGDGRTKPAHFDPEVLGVFAEHEAEFARLFDAGETGTSLPHS
jgi:putative two-component system response regulator